MDKSHPFYENRVRLVTAAQYQLNNFDYSIVELRRCDVAGRTKEENTKLTIDMLNRVIINITEYIDKHFKN